MKASVPPEKRSWAGPKAGPAQDLAMRARRSERGVALVITLIMLAVVTFMAITFLGVSRRERAAVSVTEEQTSARLMAESALSRAQAEMISRMLTQTNLLAYDLAVSTNFIERMGFNAAQPPNTLNPLNVNYDYKRSGGTLSEAERMLVIRNLYYDPRAPVYVRTNDDPKFPLDFRYYLDFNRNGRFETNGLLPVISPVGRFYDPSGLEVVPRLGGAYWSNFFVGDPEWIGVLQYPDLPHLGTNRFLGRYAYLVLPAGKTLDWNFIHNNARLGESDHDLTQIGFFRNQGFGSWELNLAAFLRDLNTNMWRRYDYLGFTPATVSDSFEDALGMLRYRYNGTYDRANLFSVETLYGKAGADSFRSDHIDGYADGAPFSGYRAPVERAGGPSSERPDRPETAWAGSDNPQSSFVVPELFDTNRLAAPKAFPLLTRWQNIQGFNASYDRYTIYRLLGQMGMDSTAANRDKLNLNYNNVAYNATNFVPWQPSEFFINAADRLLQVARQTEVVTNVVGVPVWTNYYIGDTLVRPNISVTNILLYPGGNYLYPSISTQHPGPNYKVPGTSYTPPATRAEYSATIHRLLQVAVNLCDATTNRPLTRFPYLPTVFRPTFGTTNGNIFITGHVEVTNTSFLANLRVRDLADPVDRASVRTDDVFYNVPFLIGAKKGYPNFNEFAMQNVAQISRKLEVRKTRVTDVAPSQTNLMYLLSVSNQFGIECWNSYTQDFGRRLRLQVVGDFRELIGGLSTNAITALTPLRWTNIHYATNLTTTVWPANRFILPVYRGVSMVPDSVYRPVPRPNFVPATTNDVFLQRSGYYVPDWVLVVTNRFYYALVDESVNPERLVDFVCLGSLTTSINISREVAGARGQLPVGAPPVESANVWLTNRPGGVINVQVPTEGMLNQMDISLGNIELSDQQWTSYSRTPADGLDKTKAIDRLREFVGLTPLVYNSEEERRQLRDLRDKLAVQAGYSPTRKIYQDVAWQVNDPLVHYIVEDLLDPFNRPNDPNRTNAIRFAVPPQIQLTNSNLGLLNERYRPWGGNPNQSSDPSSRQAAYANQQGSTDLSSTTSPTQSDYNEQTAGGDNLALDARVKDPLIEKSDDWEFPTNKFPNVGWLGRVHRGTPWQTMYLKSGIIDSTNWFKWAGSFGTHPTNDWRLVEVFTVAPNDNAARGLLSVNQTNLAAWSAALGGLSVLSNTTPVVGARTNAQGGFTEWLIAPDAQLNSPQLAYIVTGINRTRGRETNGTFNSLGRILATPELTFFSPFINRNNLMNDFMLERIPQQVLSLLREDQPRFVVYAFGQTLKEAPNSVSLSAGPFNKLCTNYQVRSEFALKAVIRVEGSIENPRTVVESFNELPAE